MGGAERAWSWARGFGGTSIDWVGDSWRVTSRQAATNSFFSLFFATFSYISLHFVRIVQVLLLRAAGAEAPGAECRVDCGT